MLNYVSNEEAAAGALAGVFGGLVVVSIIAYVIHAFLLMVIFKRANMKGWYAWVPIVNAWKFLEMGGQPGFWIFVPVANIIFPVLAALNIGRGFNKSSVWALLFFFLTTIWLILLAVDKSPWNPRAAGFVPLDKDADHAGQPGRVY